MSDDISSTARVRRMVMWALVPVSGFILMPIHAAEPAWWSPTVLTGGPVENQGVANIGQAKWMAFEALRTLDEVDPQAASLIRADLAAIVNLDIPDPKPADWGNQQRAMLMLGQLKALANPMYTHLNERAPIWVLEQLQENGLSTLGSDYFEDGSGGHLPWNPATPVEQNYSAANIGQLKLTFSLRFTHDTDGDTMSDYWEHAYGLNPAVDDATDDADKDGLNNLEESQNGTDPRLVDTDGDGTPDDIEVANGTDPLNPESTNVLLGLNALILTPLSN